MLLAAALTVGPAGAVSARDVPTTGDRWTPIDPTTLIAQASVTPDKLVPAGTFGVATYEIRTLAWDGSR